MSAPREALLERLWQDPRARSRNKNFHRFRDDRVYRRTVRRVRSLLSLRADLVRFAALGTIVAERLDGDRVRVVLRVPALRLRRSVYLSVFELELLRRDEKLRNLLVTRSPSHDRRS